MEEQRFVGRLDPKAARDLPVQLRKNIEASTEQRPVGFNPRKILTIRDEHRQKHDPVWGQVVYLRVMVLKEILDKLVDGHSESTVKEIDKDYDLTRIRARDILAKGTPVT